MPSVKPVYSGPLKSGLSIQVALCESEWLISPMGLYKEVLIVRWSLALRQISLIITWTAGFSCGPLHTHSSGNCGLLIQLPVVPSTCQVCTSQSGQSSTPHRKKKQTLPFPKHWQTGRPQRERENPVYSNTPAWGGFSLLSHRPPSSDSGRED